MNRTLTRIEVRERKKEGEYWVVDIDPYFEPENEQRGFRRRLSIVSKNDLDEVTDSGWKRRWTAADVSWPSAGGGEEWEISAFAEALRIAADYKRKMDLEHGIKG